MEHSPQIGDCWLWTERGSIRWWTHEETRLLSSTEPAAANFRQRVQALRDENVEIPLEQALQSELAGLLVDTLRGRSDGVRLHLAADLPTAWQEFPFQWLRFEGRLLTGHLLPVRYAPRTPAPVYSSGVGRVVILDLWSEMTAACSQPPFRDLARADYVEVVRGMRSVEAFLHQRSLAELSAICVVAHGSELDGSPPFRLAEGRLWSLPGDEPMSPLVLLLVCGNDQGNLLDYGRELLSRGARTVLAPLGRIDAPAADAFLRLFIDAWRDDATVTHILQIGQRQSGAALAAHRLELLGDSTLRRSPAGELHEQPDDRLVQAASGGSREAMGALVNRLTWRCCQESGGDLSGAVDKLFDIMGHEYGDPRSEARMLQLLDATVDRLWPISRAWVLPLAASLAANHDHTLLGKYEVLYTEQDPALPETPFTHYCWSKLFYRQGRYEDATWHLLRGLTRVAPEAPCVSGGAALFGHLVNVLVDFNLPRAGQIFFDNFLEGCLSSRSDDLVEGFRPGRMHWAAFLALRQGDMKAAFGFLRLRRERMRKEEGEDLHELAWMLYIAAWGGLPEGQALASEARERLRDRSAIVAGFGRGNESEAYLARAVAAWAWRTGDRDAVAELLPYLTLLHERAYIQDPDAPTAALAYLHLYALHHGATVSSLPSWEAVITPLAGRRYWWDLAVFSGLKGDMNEARASLAKFQRLRASLLPRFERLPAWATHDAGIDWSGEMAQSVAQENEIFARSRTQVIAALAGSGLIPL